MKTKSGTVAILGKPNVGKSTLLNRLVGEKIAGVSPKPQTTRFQVRGILTVKEKGQIVFIDTPGHHRPRDPLGKWMIKEIEKSIEGVDLIYWMVIPTPPSPPPGGGEGESGILEWIQAVKIPVILLVNQIDRFEKNDLIPVLAAYHRLYPFKELIPISAKRGDQMELLIEKTLEHLPEGEFLFPEDQISDQKERDIASEMIREKLYHKTGEEIPYSSTVVIENFKEREDGIVEIEATVVVERDSQKAIVIGKGGAKIKEIGIAARLDLEKFLGKKVFLKLLVKTQEHWRRESSSLKRLGYQ